MGKNILALNEARVGEKVQVIEIDGGRKATNRLMELGIMEGVTVDIANNGGGPLILKVGNSKFALGQGIAMKIKVKKIEECQNVSGN